MAPPNRALRNSNVRLYQTVKEKPTRQAIEEAAGQKEAQVRTPNMGSVSGQIDVPPAECKCYTNCPLLAHNPALEKRLQALTTTRNYPLFLAEKTAKYLVDDVWNPPKRHQTNAATQSLDTKEKLVVLGAGWGSAAFLHGIDTEKYDVTIISPRNYFLFTPMLAGASVGTVDFRSITQPIREVRWPAYRDFIFLCWSLTA